MKQANIANKLLGLKPRNLMVGQRGVEYRSLETAIPDTVDLSKLVHHHTSVTFLRATGQWAHAKLTEQEKADAKACAGRLEKTIGTRLDVDQYKRARKMGDTMGITQHELPLDPVTRTYVCLCHTGCDKRFDTFDDFVRHHIETLARLPEAHRLCHLCDFKFAKNCQRRYIDDHFRRHFAPQFACTKCSFKGRTETYIVLHVQQQDACSGGLPDHAFTHVSPEHRILTVGDAEHMHQKYQTADAAARTSGKAVRKRAQLGQSSTCDYQTTTEPKILLESTFKCPCCPVKLASLSAIKQHMNDVHSIIVQCGACGAEMDEKA